MQQRSFRWHLCMSLLTPFLFYLILTFHFTFLGWIFLAPAFFAIQDYYSKKKNILGVFLLSFIASFLIPLASFTWFVEYGLDFLLYASLLMGGTIFLVYISSVFISVKEPLKVFLFPLFWLFFMLVHSFLPLGNSWMNIAFLQPMSAPLIWYISSIGITFLMVFSSCLLAYFFLRRNKKYMVSFIAIVVIALFCFIYSFSVSDTGETVNVALIQGNVNESWEYRYDNVFVILERYEALTFEASTENPDIIVWPEYAIPADILYNITLFKRIQDIANRSNSYLVLGSFSHLDSTKILYYDDRYDTALVFGPDGSFVGSYDSVNPVPLDSAVISSFDSSPHFDVPNFSFTTLLCFEEYYGTDSVYESEGDFFVSSVNNQRFDNTRGIELISWFAQLRASESRKPLVRSTNTGKTQIINSKGKSISEFSLAKQGILHGTIHI